MPVLVGGAALTRHYAETELRDSYEGRLYYGKDAFEGLAIMQALSEGRLAEIDAEIDERVGKRREAERRRRQRLLLLAPPPQPSPDMGEGLRPLSLWKRVGVRAYAHACRSRHTRSELSRAETSPSRRRRSWGSRVVEDVPLDAIYPTSTRSRSSAGSGR